MQAAACGCTARPAAAGAAPAPQPAVAPSLHPLLHPHPAARHTGRLAGGAPARGIVCNSSRCRGGSLRPTAAPPCKPRNHLHHHQGQATSSSRDGGRASVACAAGPNRDGGGGQGGRDASAQISLNPTYLVIVGVYAGLLALRNPYIFAGLTIATIIPQNSTTTSLNSLVLFFYDTGLFQNFAEAVYCVRLMTWLSIACSLVSFALFA